MTNKQIQAELNELAKKLLEVDNNFASIKVAKILLTISTSLEDESILNFLFKVVNGASVTIGVTLIETISSRPR